MKRRIRPRELLCGVVEVDESYVGARHRGIGGRRLAGKAIVAIAVEGNPRPSGCGSSGSLT
jgi:hypothetical protein